MATLVELGEVAKALLKPAHIKALETERGRGILAALTQGTDDATKRAIARGNFAADRLAADEAGRSAAKELSEKVRSTGNKIRYPYSESATGPVRSAKREAKYSMERAMARKPYQYTGATRKKHDVQSRVKGLSRYGYARSEFARAKSEIKYGRVGNRNRWEF